MNEKLFNFVLNVVTVKEPKEASEWIDVKGRVEEEKFRKLSADLERRRIRRYNKHIVEQEKVKQELDGLQRDRLRFEREKALRRRNTFSTARERKRSQQTSPRSAEDPQLVRLKQNAFSGGSASIAFDPSSLKYGSRHKRRTKTAPGKYGKGNMATSESLNGKNATGLDVETQRESPFGPKHYNGRTWGAAWSDAKKERTNEEDKARWTALMLKAEKEKMKLLSEKWIALKESKLASIKNVLHKKNKGVSDSWGKDGEGGVVKEPVAVRLENGQALRYLSAIPNGQAVLPSPNARSVKYPRSTKQPRDTLEKYKKREAEKGQTKMPSIFIKEGEENKESSSSESSMVSIGTEAEIPALKQGRKAKIQEQLQEGAKLTGKPLPVVGNFLPRVQLKTPEN